MIALVEAERPFSSHLEKVKDLQMAFKTPAVRAFAILVVTNAVQHGHVWPDEIATASLAPEDRNCIGTIYRWLSNVGIIIHSAAFRRSTADGAKGRTIFRYDLNSRALANIFLERHAAAVAPVQPDLFK